jgi:hypothetical protein
MKKSKSGNKNTVVIICIVILLILAAIAGVITAKKAGADKGIKEQLSELYTRAETLVNNAEKPHEQGRITTDDYNEIIKLKDMTQEAIDMVDSKDYDVDEINDKIFLINDGLNKYEELIESLGTVDDDADEYCNYVKDAADLLEPYMQKALDEGKITQERYDEFKSLYEDIEVIMRQPTQSDISTLKEILQKMAVMGSQVGAPPDLMDTLTEYKGDDAVEDDTDETTEATTVKSEEKATQKTTEKVAQSETKAPLSNDVSQLIASVIDFQNESSQRYEKGEITEEQYRSIIQLGIEAAQIKEEMEKGGNTEELNKKAEDVKTRTYAVAQKVNSEYADSFK